MNYAELILGSWKLQANFSTIFS
jgi:hypothetical protein